jgi:hypothetical protein
VALGENGWEGEEEVTGEKKFKELKDSISGDSSISPI